VRREPTVAVQVVHALMARAARLGPAGRPLITKVTVAREVLEDVDGRVPAAIVRELWTDLPAACDDPFFGLTLAASVPDGALGIVAYLAQHAPTLGQGFTAAVRYARLLQDVADCFIEPVSDGALRFVQAAPARGPAPPRHAVEFAFARAIFAARRSTAVDVTPTRVRFAFARPATIEAYGPVFGACVSFDHRRNELELDAATLALPQREADPWLRALVEARARDLLGRLGPDRAFTSRVAGALGVAIQRGDGDLAAVARALSLSPRALQRRLQAEGRSFRDVADDARHELARRYLADRTHSLAEIALMLGFSEQAAFQRAFVRWAGVTPGQLRRELLEAPARA
jgi:AraC-like DNA-binding protein